MDVRIHSFDGLSGVTFDLVIEKGESISDAVPAINAKLSELVFKRDVDIRDLNV